MSTDQGTSFQAKSGWDKRAWWTALVFCALVFGLEAIANNSFVRERVSEGLADISGIAGGVLTFLIFPPILSGIARKRTFFWAYLPLLAFGFWYLVMNADDLVRRYFFQKLIFAGAALDLEVIGFCCVIPVITAGPVCLFRVFRRRAIRSQAKALAMERATHEVREGIWPPPPATIGQDSGPEKAK